MPEETDPTILPPRKRWDYHFNHFKEAFRAYSRPRSSTTIFLDALGREEIGIRDYFKHIKAGEQILTLIDRFYKDWDMVEEVFVAVGEELLKADGCRFDNEEEFRDGMEDYALPDLPGKWKAMCERVKKNAATASEEEAKRGD